MTAGLDGGTKAVLNENLERTDDVYSNDFASGV
jgi:hypothetical protein